MTRNVSTNGWIVAGLSVILSLSQQADAADSAEQTVAAAGRNNRFSFVMFYRSNDAATQRMYGTLKSTLEERDDAVIVPVRIGGGTQPLVKRFDATRLPMPAVAVLAPNDAVCSVFPQRVSSQQLTAAIVSPAQAECLKALQDSKLVMLCVHPEPSADVPFGVEEFRSEDLFKDRTQVVTVHAGDAREERFLRQLRVPTDRENSVVAFMAPPGVMIGVFSESVTHRQLAEKLAAAGRCCDDENCKYHRSAKRNGR